MEFSRQEYCSGLPCLPAGSGSSWPRDRTQLSCIADSLLSEPWGKPSLSIKPWQNFIWECILPWMISLPLAVPLTPFQVCPKSMPLIINQTYLNPCFRLCFYGAQPEKIFQLLSIILKVTMKTFCSGRPSDYKQRRDYLQWSSWQTFLALLSFLHSPLYSYGEKASFIQAGDVPTYTRLCSQAPYS